MSDAAGEVMSWKLHWRQLLLGVIVVSGCIAVLWCVSTKLGKQSSLTPEQRQRLECQGRRSNLAAIIQGKCAEELEMGRQVVVAEIIATLHDAEPSATACNVASSPFLV